MRFEKKKLFYKCNILFCQVPKFPEKYFFNKSVQNNVVIVVYIYIYIYIYNRFVKEIFFRKFGHLAE